MVPSEPSGDARRDVPFLARFIATGFFTGYIPLASGTFGSLLALLLYAIPGVEQWAVHLLLILLTVAAGTPAAARVAAVEGHRLSSGAAVAKAIFQPETLHAPDPSIVVIDEMLGMWLALFLLPKTITAMAVAFVLFRVLDVVKPPPARQAEQFGKGWGIMLDDAVAGVYANLLTRGVLILLSLVAGLV